MDDINIDDMELIIIDDESLIQLLNDVFDKQDIKWIKINYTVLHLDLLLLH